MPSIFSCHDNTLDVTSSSSRVVPHIAQRDVWDCGIACVAMICGYISPRLFPRESAYQKVRDALETSRFQYHNGLWTIHLVMLLHDLLHSSTSVNILFSSTVIGVNPEHASLGYYSETLSSESEQVESLFQEATKRPNLIVRKEVLDLRAMISVLMNSHEEVLFLCLVDAKKLKCKCQVATQKFPGFYGVLQSTFQLVTSSLTSSAANSPTTSSKRRSELSSINDGGGEGPDSIAVPILVPSTTAGEPDADYVGHYVVVCGYHAPSEQILYRNPCRGEPVEGEGWLCAESIHSFEAARAATGTDYDTVMVAIPRLEGSGTEEDFGVL